MKMLFVLFMAALSLSAFAENTADIAARIKARVAAKQTGEFTQRTKTGMGHVKFDHTKNDGKFTITDGSKTFVTAWSGCITGKIYAYREQNGLVGYKEGYGKFPRQASEFERILDFSNRVAVVNVGDVVLFVNAKGDFLAVHLLAVKYVDRGDNEYCIEFEYRIY